MTLVYTGDGQYTFRPHTRNRYCGDMKAKGLKVANCCDSESRNCDGKLWYRGQTNTSSVNNI